MATEDRLARIERRLAEIEAKANERMTVGGNEMDPIEGLLLLLQAMDVRIAAIEEEGLGMGKKAKKAQGQNRNEENGD